MTASSPTIDLQLAHRSVRRFLDEPVTDEQLETVIAAAQAASQSSNLQVWSVVAVRDEGRKRRLSRSIGGHRYVEEASVFLVWVADFRRAANIVETTGARLETIGYLENTLVAVVDSGIAAQNALLAAESLGLGGVFVGSIRNDPEAVIAELGLPEYTFPVFGLALGVPDPSEQAGLKPRLPQSAVLHHEVYEETAWQQPAAEYEGDIAAYYAGYGQDDYSWVAKLTARISTVAGLHGREHIRESLEKQGFASR